MSNTQASEELRKACEALRSNDLDMALLTSMPNVTYITGWEVPAALGPAAELTGWLPNGTAIVNARDETAWLVVSDLLAGPARRASRVEHLEVFSGFGHFEQVDAAQSYRDVLAATLQAAGATTRRCRIGVEPHSLPLTAHEVLARALPDLELGNADPSLQAARKVKTAREIELIRKAVAVADAAQNQLIRQSENWGQSDLDAWDALLGKMERMVGHTVTNIAELVTGRRTAAIAPGGPIGRTIEEGDTGLLDISPRIDRILGRLHEYRGLRP